MSSFTESLTIRILGDSTHLERELEKAARRLDEFSAQLGRAADFEAPLGRLEGGFAGLARPLDGVGRKLERIGEQARGLGRIPITLNVAPAMAALAALGGAIEGIGARLHALSAAAFVPGGGLPVPVRGFAQGGTVAGPAGTDRVPALLTAGEFVIREPAARRLGTAFLNALNQAAPLVPPPAAPAPPAVANHTTHFGGVTIQVARAAEVNEIVRDLRLHGARLRNRRG